MVDRLLRHRPVSGFRSYPSKQGFRLVDRLLRHRPVSGFRSYPSKQGFELGDFLDFFETDFLGILFIYKIKLLLNSLVIIIVNQNDITCYLFPTFSKIS